ncbi:MAG: response regulator [Lachnospiraceae bacterium]|nr:response regulator [Lachnospiraceae bacterium]
MIKLLIVDDEPLVQAGIKSMINWEELGISIAGVAANGQAAYEMIQQYHVEIVITDIKMPVMSGLDLARKCYDEGLDLPVFIILTSYEDFHYAKEALTCQAIDYLIKLELTPETLTKSLKRAIKRISELSRSVMPSDYAINTIFREQFFTRLIFNLFESEHQFQSQSKNLNIDFDYGAFATGYIEINSQKLSEMTADQQISLYTSSLQMVSELMSKYIACYVLSLDIRHFCIIFFLKNNDVANYRENIQKALEQVSAMLFNYYSVTIRSSIGSPVEKPMQIASSYQDARQIFSQVTANTPILFFENVSGEKPLKNVFNMSLFKDDIRKAYAEMDEQALYDVFSSIIELFEEQPAHYVQALDAAGNILYLSLSLLSDGEQIVSEIFAGYNNGYRSLYELSGVDQILSWMKTLRDGLCAEFAARNRDYKNHIVINAKKYITQHIEEKLTLNDVAEVFSISPNYLSVLFSKYNDIGFSDFINQSKIETAKKMMAEGDYRIYEISDILGFESAFYFSRVFKKVTGFSPRDYMKTIS